MKRLLSILLLCGGCLQPDRQPTLVAPRPGPSPVDTCDREATLRCGDVEVGTTAGGSTAIDRWPCVGFDDLGPEVTYRFIPGRSGTAIVTLSDLDEDLDLFVTTGACTEGDCLSSAASGTEDEVISGPIVDGETYHITVDSFTEGTSSIFTLQIECE